jgi:D-alanine-D-alanine ligase
MSPARSTPAATTSPGGGAPLAVGITYDLRDDHLAAGYGEEETAEFDRRDTIDAIDWALRRLGHLPERIGHAQALVERLARGESWDLVFNIAEGLHGFGREALVPALLDAYGIPYTFSDPLVMSLTLHKGLTKRVIRDAGLPTPDFAVVSGPQDLAGVELPLPVFVKPVAEGTGKGVSPASVVRRREELWPQCRAMIDAHRQPALVEAYLPGRELTVGVLGSGAEAAVLGTLEVVLLPAAEAGVYSYVNKERCEELIDYRLVRAEADAIVRRAEALALAAWRTLGCRDGGRVDLRCDAAGNPCFLEVNPLSGLHPEHSDLPILCQRLGIPYVELIGRILASAAVRIAPADRGAAHARSGIV